MSRGSNHLNCDSNDNIYSDTYSERRWVSESPAKVIGGWSGSGVDSAFYEATTRRSRQTFKAWLSRHNLRSHMAALIYQINTLRTIHVIETLCGRQNFSHQSSNSPSHQEGFRQQKPNVGDSVSVVTNGCATLILFHYLHDAIAPDRSYSPLTNYTEAHLIGFPSAHLATLSLRRRAEISASGKFKTKPGELLLMLRAVMLDR